jgi:ABC-type multidrug transport system ATPase subunit
VRDLRVPAGRITMLIGFDRAAAEVFVNLITGASLPDKGQVLSLGRPTTAIADSDEWLGFVERFGIVSDRIVQLEAMTVSQNLAISFDLDIEPVPPAVMTRVSALAAEVGIEQARLETPVSDAPPLVRSQIYLARALAFNPDVLVLEHPTAHLERDAAKTFAEIIKVVAEKRGLTTIGLLMDKAFANATGGRLLMWQPATGEISSPSRFARLRAALRRG